MCLLKYISYISYIRIFYPSQSGLNTGFKNFFVNCYPPLCELLPPSGAVFIALSYFKNVIVSHILWCFLGSGSICRRTVTPLNFFFYRHYKRERIAPLPLVTLLSSCGVLFFFLLLLLPLFFVVLLFGLGSHSILYEYTNL